VRIPPAHEFGVIPRELNEQGADVTVVGGKGKTDEQGF